MSNVCKTCNQPISWDMDVRKKLGIRGPINPDGSIHRCMGVHKQEQQDAVLEATTSTTKTMEVTKPQLTDEEINILKQFVAMLKLVKQ